MSRRNVVDGWIHADIDDDGWFGNTSSSCPRRGELADLKNSGSDVKIRVTNTKGLVALPDYFLKGCSSLQEVDLSGLSKVTTIGGGFLLDCSSLQQVDLSPLSNTTAVGDWFLYACSSLQQVDLSPLSITTVGGYFLHGCSSLQQVNLAGLAAVTKVGDCFLYDCSALQQVDLSPLLNVTTVGNFFLEGSSSLLQVDLSPLSSVTSVGDDFLNGSRLLQQVDLSGLPKATMELISTKLSIKPSVKVLKEAAKQRNAGSTISTTQLNVADGWIQADICDAVWYGNTSSACPRRGDLADLKNSGSEVKVRVTNTKGLTALPDYFLQYCSAPQQVDLSGLSAITSVGDNFLEGCSSLEQVDLSPLSNVAAVGVNFLYGCKSLQQVDLSGLSNATAMGNHFLCNCSSLLQLDLSPLLNVSTVGVGFLLNCWRLQQVDLSPLSNVTTSGNFFLHGCTSLQQVDLSGLPESTMELISSKLSIKSSVRVLRGNPPTPKQKPAKEQPVASPSTNGTFEASEFLAVHRKPESRPEKLYHLLAALDGIIHTYAAAHGIPKPDADAFFNKLQSNAFTSGGMAEVLDPQQLMHIAVRLWTSAEDLRGRELCGILNEAIRNDAQPAIGHAVMLAHAINAFCVTRRGSSVTVKWPADNRVYRGGAMPQAHRSFFQPGTTYRAPMYVATSCDEDTAIDFMRRLAPATAEQQPAFQEPVLWVFHFDATLPETKRCVHVNYIDRTDGSVSGEDEMLFAPYSVFTVRSVAWEASPMVDSYTTEPHRIEIDVAPDNSKAVKDLPLAPWC